MSAREGTGPAAGEVGHGAVGREVVVASAVEVVEPTTVDGVRAALDDAARKGLAVLPMGACVDLRRVSPAREFVLLSTRGLTGLEEYEPADLTLTARAGTPLSEVAGSLAAHGQWFPFDPPRALERTVGGMVATGATGPLQAGYGAPRDHVLGATVVTGDGVLLRLGGRVMKNVAGFDLLKLMVGSRGTLGVVVSATVRVFPRPVVDRILVVTGPTRDMLEAGRRVATAPVMPASAVVHEPDGSGRASLAVRLHGSAASVDAETALLRGHVDLPFAVLDDEEALGHATTLTDAADGAVVVRASGVPDGLARVCSTIRHALPESVLVADVMSGRVRASVDGVADAGLLREARGQLEAAGGGLIMTRGPDHIRKAVGVPASRDGGVFEALRARFDGRNVLLAGGLGA